MDLQAEHAFLRQKFLQDAHVIDKDKGYISVPSFNLRMDPAVLKAAAHLICDFFKDSDIDIVHGIPHSGNYLATAVALELDGVMLHISKKDLNIPSTWKEIYHREIRSFTHSGQGLDIYSPINLSFVHKGDRVLIVDDVCAYGETGHAIISGLLERGVKVQGYAVLFDKQFQSGLARIEELGIKTFSCIRVAKLEANDRVRLVA
jgi:adenine/guanine phosphoribosyltransferase-like PRPP-binding protein